MKSKWSFWTMIGTAAGFGVFAGLSYQAKNNTELDAAIRDEKVKLYTNISGGFALATFFFGGFAWAKNAKSKTQ